MPACRHCKSPARDNPCWWNLDRGTDWDPPCIDDNYADEWKRRQQRNRERTRNVFGVLAFVLIVIVLYWGTK